MSDVPHFIFRTKITFQEFDGDAVEACLKMIRVSMSSRIESLPAWVRARKQLGTKALDVHTRLHFTQQLAKATHGQVRYDDKTLDNHDFRMFCTI